MIKGTNVLIAACCALFASSAHADDALSDEKTKAIYKILCHKLNRANPVAAQPQPARNFIAKLNRDDLISWFEAAQGTSVSSTNPCLNQTPDNPVYLAIKTAPSKPGKGPVIPPHPIHGGTQSIVQQLGSTMLFDK
jgi:hypothetical protein